MIRPFEDPIAAFPSLKYIQESKWENPRKAKFPKDHASNLMRHPAILKEMIHRLFRFKAHGASIDYDQLTTMEIIRGKDCNMRQANQLNTTTL